MKQFKISKRVLLILTLVYIYLPMALFLFGWMKIYIALPIAIAIGYGMTGIYKSYILSDSDNDSALEISWMVFTAVILFVILMTCYMGWGRFTAQTGDWLKHNGVMADLTNKSWPVYYTSYENSMLTYYIGQYLVPAAVGKLNGSFRAAEVMNYIWCTFGIIIIYFNMIRVLKLKTQGMQLFSAALMFFFSLPLLFCQRIAEFLIPDFFDMMVGNSWMHNQYFVMWGDVYLQYSSHITLLRWVFIQVIVAWLLMTWLYENSEKVEAYVTLLIPAFLCGSFSFLGLAFLAAGFAVYYAVMNKNNIAAYLKRLLSPENVLVAVFLGGSFAAYFWGNVTGEKPDYMKFHMMDYGDRFIYYIVFVFTMVVSVGLCIFWHYKRNVFFWLNIGFLIILPIFKMGMFNDLGMRASIPSMFGIMMLIIGFFRDYQTGKLDTNSIGTSLSLMFLSFFLLLGAFTSYNEIYDVALNDDIKNLAGEVTYGTMEGMTDRSNEENRADDTYNYYTYELENDFFYNNLARVKITE